MLGKPGESEAPKEIVITPGVIVTRTAEGSVCVVADGRDIGWLHASVGDRWVAIVYPDVRLGKFRLDAAALAIARAYHEKSA